MIRGFIGKWGGGVFIPPPIGLLLVHQIVKVKVGYFIQRALHTCIENCQKKTKGIQEEVEIGEEDDTVMRTRATRA